MKKVIAAVKCSLYITFISVLVFGGSALFFMPILIVMGGGNACYLFLYIPIIFIIAFVGEIFKK